MSNPSTRAQSLRQLRLVLGLNQTELGWLLGLGERTIARIETEGEETGLDWPVQRLLWLIGETRVEDAETMLRALLLEADGSASVPERQEALATALTRLRSLSLAAGLRLKDGRVSQWVYWATGARAEAAETLALALEAGVVCRPLGPTVPNSVSSLRPEDRVLLCHNAEPLTWLTLMSAEDPKCSGVAAVFRLVPASSALGRRLRSNHYRLMDGSIADGKSGTFSCLAVKKLAAPLITPAPRGRGIRDTITPFTASN